MKTEKEIILEGRKIFYTLRKSRRAKKIRLTIYGGGEITVTVPLGLKEELAEEFVRKKSRWLLSKISFTTSYEKSNFHRSSRQDYLKNKEKARRLVTERINHLNRVYRFTFNKISIKNQKTRWGSCSEKGNLNFNYKIINLPQPLIDYIVVHELCHLKELNHSPRFWKLVEKTIPDYLKLRIELKKTGRQIS